MTFLKQKVDVTYSVRLVYIYIGNRREWKKTINTTYQECLISVHVSCLFHKQIVQNP